MASSSSAAGSGMPDPVTADSVCVNHGSQQEGEIEVLPDEDRVEWYTPPVGPDAEEYRMDHERRGRAIIFNHKKYSPHLNLTERSGTETDKIILKQRFEKLKFEVDVYDDLTVADIKKKLTEISKDDHKNEDCIVVAVLTHGKGKGKLYAYDDFYRADTLWSSFTGDVCPSLGGKPKLFIVQACRGEEASEGMSFKSSIQIDSHNMNTEASHRYSIPVEADLLVAFSTYEGRAALRHVEGGTWFIQELCKELEDNGETLDLLSLFTNVNRRVAVHKEYKKLKQMPVVQSTLTRKVFFGSMTARSRITITSDVFSLQERTMEKLDVVIGMLENTIVSIPVPRTGTAKKLSSSLNWDSLQSSKQTVVGPLPEMQDVYRIAEALKVFLEDEADKLKPVVKEGGEFILNFISCWDNLTKELRCYGYKKLVVFLNENARNWRVYKLLHIPDICSLNTENSHRRWSQSDVTDSDSTSGRRSTIPRRIAPKK